MFLPKFSGCKIGKMVKMCQNVLLKRSDHKIDACNRFLVSKNPGLVYHHGYICCPYWQKLNFYILPHIRIHKNGQDGINLLPRCSYHNLDACNRFLASKYPDLVYHNAYIGGKFDFRYVAQIFP